MMTHGEYARRLDTIERACCKMPLRGGKEMGLSGDLLREVRYLRARPNWDRMIELERRYGRMPLRDAQSGGTLRIVTKWTSDTGSYYIPVDAEDVHGAGSVVVPCVHDTYPAAPQRFDHNEIIILDSSDGSTVTQYDMRTINPEPGTTLRWFYGAAAVPSAETHAVLLYAVGGPIDANGIPTGAPWSWTIKMMDFDVSGGTFDTPVTLTLPDTLPSCFYPYYASTYINPTLSKPACDGTSVYFLAMLGTYAWGYDGTGSPAYPTDFDATLHLLGYALSDGSLTLDIDLGDEALNMSKGVLSLWYPQFGVVSPHRIGGYDASTYLWMFPTGLARPFIYGGNYYHIYGDDTDNLVHAYSTSTGALVDTTDPDDTLYENWSFVEVFGAYPSFVFNYNDVKNKNTFENSHEDLGEIGSREWSAGSKYGGVSFVQQLATVPSTGVVYAKYVTT